MTDAEPAAPPAPSPPGRESTTAPAGNPTDTDLAKLVDRLVQARQAKDWTQIEVGHALQVPWTTIQRIESHLLDPPASLLLAYARAVGVELAP